MENKYRKRRKEIKFEPHFCDICETSCNSEKTFKVHVEGKFHSKMLVTRAGNNWFCRYCKIYLENQTSWEAHLKTFSHMNFELIETSKSTKFSNEIIDCKICDKSYHNNLLLQQHLSGKKHKMKMQEKELISLIENHDSRVYCASCNKVLNETTMPIHLESKKHKIKSRDIEYTKNSMEFCPICKEELMDRQSGISHYKSDTHKTNYDSFDWATNKKLFWCELCKIRANDQAGLNLHLNGFRHYQREINTNSNISITKFQLKLDKIQRISAEIKSQIENRKKRSNITSIDAEDLQDIQMDLSQKSI